MVASGEGRSAAQTLRAVERSIRSRSGPNSSQIKPARITSAIIQRIAIASTTTLTAGHWNRYWRKTFARSVIQCQAVWATNAERIIVPMRSATTNRNRISNAGINSASIRICPSSHAYIE